MLALRPHINASFFIKRIYMVYSTKEDRRGGGEGVKGEKDRNGDTVKEEEEEKEWREGKKVKEEEKKELWEGKNVKR